MTDADKAKAYDAMVEYMTNLREFYRDAANGVRATDPHQMYWCLDRAYFLYEILNRGQLAMGTAKAPPFNDHTTDDGLGPHRDY